MVIIAFLGMTAVACMVQTKNAQAHMVQNARLKLEQISRTLEHNDRELKGIRRKPTGSPVRKRKAGNEYGNRK